jgi:methylated-DNA-[protein]-cysteine S-methyltransferase
MRISGKWSFYYDISYNNKRLAVLCHIADATLGLTKKATLCFLSRILDFCLPFPKLFIEKSPVMKTYKTYYKSPLGPIKIVGNQDCILSLDFVEEESPGDADLPFCLKAGLKQIDEYFKGNRREFLLKLDPKGTKFQKSVWRQLEKIPFGDVVTYADIAGIIGNPKAYRAVGSANGRNPISIIIPCHRVIGSDGRLTGYGGGLWRKEWLIKHEKGFHPENIIA